MSKHTVSLNGIDTGKIGNNKKVKLSEEFPDPSKITTTSEYAEFKGITPEAALAELNPTGNLVPVIPTQEKKDNFFTKTFPMGIPVPLPIGGVQTIKPKSIYGTGELEYVDGKLVGKDRPKGALGKLSSVADAFTFGLTDYDQLGGGLLGSDVSLSGYGAKPTDFKLSKTIKDQLKEESELENKGPLDDAEKRLDFLEKNQDRIRAINRKDRRDAAIDAQLQYMATEPVRQAFLNRAAEQAMQRGLRVRGALEAMPSNIQNIMTAKQAQRSLASSAFAEEARALATQQDAATRFAGLGMQRRFG